MASFFDEDEVNVVPLITCQDGEYQLHEDTAAWLRQHTRPFAIVACAGKYRTGKSFLLNRLAKAPPGNGFGVGNSVQACTKGLWIYKQFFPSSDGTKDVLFIDTEGIDALDANDTHDVRIFTLALLLSSTFLYNSVGAIDETAMQTLSLMARVTENVRVSNGETDEGDVKLSDHMPHFIWILRDFGLQLIDKQGNQFSQQQYLENALHTEDRKKSTVRDAIRNTFEHRTLMTLPRPTNESNIQMMEDRPLAVNASFTEAIDQLRTKLMDESLPFSINGTQVTGNMYASLCEHLSKVVQTNAVPIMRDSWTLMAEVQCRDIMIMVTEGFERVIKTTEKSNKDTITRKMDAQKAACVEKFEKEALKPVPDSVKQMFVEKMNSLYASAIDDLSVNVAEYVVAILDKVEPLVYEDSINAVSVVEREAVIFFTEHGSDPETLSTWKTLMHERSHTRWFPHMAKTYATQEVALNTQIETLRKRYESLQEEMLTHKELEERAFRVKRKELEQQLESSNEELLAIREKNRQLEDHVVQLETKLSMLTEAAAESASACVPNEESEHVGSDAAAHAQEECEQLSLKNIQLQTELREQRDANSEKERTIAELKDSMARSTTLHATLESSWKDGLQKIKEEEKVHKENMLAKQRALESKADGLGREKEGLETQVATLTSDACTASKMHEHEKQQLRDASVRYREQCEVAQQRVLDIHKSMLDDLRTRDERTREQQAINLKERAEYQAKNAELCRENERLRELGHATKRRVSELENVERECKRIRQQHQESSMLVTRLESENVHLRQQSDRVGDDRERLRQENMQLEGELAVLRAEKQLWDARKSLN